MLDKREKEICSVQYEVTQFPAMVGIRIAVKLAKLFGRGVGEAASGADIMNMNVARVVGAIVENLDEASTPKMIAELLSKTSRDGVILTEEAINKTYSGNYLEMLEALRFVIEVNYGGFFEALTQGNLIGKPLSAGNPA